MQLMKLFAVGNLDRSLKIIFLATRQKFNSRCQSLKQLLFKRSPFYNSKNIFMISEVKLE